MSAKKTGFELFTIVFGVMLAMFLSEWWQDKERHENNGKALTIVLKELETLKANLNLGIIYHEKVKLGVLEVVQSGAFDTPLGDVDGCCQLKNEASLNVAYQTALAKGLFGALEAETTLILVAPYMKQSELQTMVNAHLDAMLMGTINDMERYYLNYFIFLGNVMPLEYNMLTLVDDAIKEAKRVLAEEYT